MRKALEKIVYGLMGIRAQQAIRSMQDSLFTGQDEEYQVLKRKFKALKKIGRDLRQIDWDQRQLAQLREGYLHEVQKLEQRYDQNSNNLLGEIYVARIERAEYKWEFAIDLEVITQQQDKIRPEDVDTLREELQDEVNYYWNLL